MKNIPTRAKTAQGSGQHGKVPDIRTVGIKACNTAGRND